MFVTPSAINPAACFRETQHPASGAHSTFIGVVRDHDQGRRVSRLYYECYAPMVEKLIENWADEARRRWDLNAVYVRHRVGELAVGQIAVVVAVSAAHRDAAFMACRFLIEAIKHKAPIWKKQFFEDGWSEWTLCAQPTEHSTC